MRPGEEPTRLTNYAGNERHVKNTSRVIKAVLNINAITRGLVWELGDLLQGTLEAEAADTTHGKQVVYALKKGEICDFL